MDFYERKRRVALDLAAWLKETDDPVPFEELARDLLVRYGVSRKSVERTLREEFGVEWDEPTKELRRVGA